jgi:hypothetical protein
LDIKCAPRRLGPQCKLCRGGALEKWLDHMGFAFTNWWIHNLMTIRIW